MEKNSGKVEKEIPVEKNGGKVEKVEKGEENNNIVEKEKNIQQLDELKNIRIGNTLSKFNKKKMLQLKEKKESVRTYILDDKAGKYASILLDGEIKAASDEYIIYMYEKESDVEFFNSNLIDLEKIFEKSVNEKFRMIAVEKTEWDKIKDDFNNKKVKYEYKEEPEIVITENKKSKSEIDELFDGIVEYTEEEI